MSSLVCDKGSARIPCRAVHGGSDRHVRWPSHYMAALAGFQGALATGPGLRRAFGVGRSVRTMASLPSGDVFFLDTSVNDVLG